MLNSCQRFWNWQRPWQKARLESCDWQRSPFTGASVRIWIARLREKLKYKWSVSTAMIFSRGLVHSRKSGGLGLMAANMKLCVVLSLAFLLAGCSQNIEVVSSGERLEDSPKPVVDP